jgi:uncharacterized protein (DUF1778 family)
MVSEEATMTETKRAPSRRPRISLDVSPELRRRLRVAAARRDTSVGNYVTVAIEERLAADLTEEQEETTALTAASDHVLAELWDNPADAAYDQFETR